MKISRGKWRIPLTGNPLTIRTVHLSAVYFVRSGYAFYTAMNSRIIEGNASYYVSTRNSMS